MKRTLTHLAVLFLMSAATASAQNVSTGVSIANGHLNSFYLAIGDYYHVPQPQVVHFRNHYRIRDEELPVVFFLASRAHVDPQVIIDLRMRRRMSWLNITFHYGLTPEIYYIPVTRVGPPYGKAYGYYKKYKQNYKRVILRDTDVVNLVNLRFMSEYHGIAPELVIDRRGRGERFVAMNHSLREEKIKRGDRKDDKGNGKDRKDKDRDREKGRGRG